MANVIIQNPQAVANQPAPPTVSYSVKDCLKAAHISVCATVAASILLCSIASKNPSENNLLTKAVSTVGEFISENPKACAKTAIGLGLLWDGVEFAQKAWNNKFQTCCVGLGIAGLALI